MDRRKFISATGSLGLASLAVGGAGVSRVAAADIEAGPFTFGAKPGPVLLDRTVAAEATLKA